MSRREGMSIRKCGCITYEHGPPFECEKHLRRAQELEEKGLRKAVREQASELGHELTQFDEYESLPGKWTSYCPRCGSMVIVYDAPPVRGDQVAGKALSQRCTGRSQFTTSV